ncbi:DDE-type integrase/transposase/recombinase [Halomonas faecis]|uniref:DDE-type integrase/transposase/recombinase n=1 Tax=Halomonas faecis TaxID=1562110 RepID=UPI0013D78732|nr:DDE-type integrase/transposase/recombinase [Halomonas faecis]
MKRKALPGEAVLSLRRRLDALPARSAERRCLVEETAGLYGVSTATVYRALRERMRPKALRRADCGKTRKMPVEEMERYCEVIAALKVRTTNKQGRHLSTVRAIELLEQFGVDTPQGFLKPPPGLLTKASVNRYLKGWGYDRLRFAAQPPAVRFQARHSNECWHFDMSPSDLKHIKKPPWIEDGRSEPTLMLFSVVDDRSGACYQEYRCVYGEDAESGLRFLFNAMAPKADHFPFQGIPTMIYTDNGPIAKSRVFQHVMDYLGVQVRTHLPAGKDGRRITARSKGKVERPFRTVKEAHEVLYHFHQPETEEEANRWLLQYLLHYNGKPHRTEPHSRIEDWLRNLPEAGVQQMCSWERFCTFAREPERRRVGPDARVAVDGVAYEVDADLAGEQVILWWGIFDNELYVEHGQHRHGPYFPVGGPIPLHRYRKFKKTRTEKRADRIEELAAQLGLPRAALDGHSTPAALPRPVPSPEPVPARPFRDPDPFQELRFPNAITAKKAIAEFLCQPLARLPQDDCAFIEDLVAETLAKREITDRIRRHFKR